MKVSTLFQGLLGLVLFCSQVHGYDPTDTIMDADSSQSGYLPNHNMDPSVLGGGSFGQIWQYNVPTNPYGQTEQFYAKPLVYTPSTLNHQLVFVFSEQNKIYSLDAVNGSLFATRDLAIDGEFPFQVSDLGSCNDISGTIGITGTPVIDPTTDTIYFWAKSYSAPGLSGWQNGAYYFHAIDAVTLKERSGFPVNINGEQADNDPTRYFTGGTHLQRASLNMVNGIVFAGFGGHCDQYNYTGWVVGMSTSGEYLTGYSTSAGPNSPPQDGTWNGGGGGCGVWMAGMPLVSDNSGRLFFSTGNAYKIRDNGVLPSSGRIQLDTLSEAVVNLAINSSTGALTQNDYFESYTYGAMDAADRDLGSGGVILLDPVTFHGGGVSRVAIACGKNGNCYVMDADDLGGYKQGPGGGDAILQTLTPPGGGSMFGNPGSYPLEGGYLYLTPVGSPTFVYSLGFDSSGRPQFTYVTQTIEVATGRAGVGPPTITTLKNQAGTGILWILDPDSGLRAYNAAPVNGQMVRIPLPPSPAVSKYQRPVFGNGRYYMTTEAATIVGYGSPVAMPLTCNDPLNFGSVAIGSTAILNVTCTANIPITTLSFSALQTSIYQVQNSSLPQGSLNAGASFTFPVTFNLTGSSNVAPGTRSAAIVINTINGVSGYSSQKPLSITGQAQSDLAFPSVSPLQVDFQAVILGSAAAISSSSSTFNIQNIGQSDMTILGYAFTNSTSISAPDTNVTMGVSTNGTYVLDSNGLFTSANLPNVGTVIHGGSSVTVDVSFQTSVAGSYFSIFQIFTDGGMVYTTFTASGDTAPIALLQYSTSEGGMTTIPDCVDLVNGCTAQVDMGSALGATQLLTTITFTNIGGSDMTIGKSKPLEGAILGAVNPTSDLYEGMVIPPGNSSSAGILFSPGLSVLNADPVVYSGIWTLNTDDLTFGTHFVNFTATLVSPQVGPLINGKSQFKYLGCYQDNVANRIEPQMYGNANNTNGLCQQQALAFNAAFAGTEYNTECWVGNAIPASSLLVADSLCLTYLCPGDTTQLCGGTGGYMSMYYDATKYFPQNGTLASSVKPASSEPIVGPYKYAGCFVDSTTSRALSGYVPPGSSTNTLETCATTCSARGYSYFGTEYSQECYCGNVLGSIATLATDSDCKMTCAGNNKEICGGSSRISVYTLNNNATTNFTLLATSSSASSSLISTASVLSSITSTSSAVPAAQTLGAYAYVGCQTDSVINRTLTAKFVGSSSMTVENCMTACVGYRFFGVEYSQECYCGNTLLASSTIATDGRCSMTCAGNAAEICGGPNGLSLYQLNISNNISTTALALSSTPTSSAGISLAFSTLVSSSFLASSSLSQSTANPVLSSTPIVPSLTSSTSSPSALSSSSAYPTSTVILTCPTANYTDYTASNGAIFLMECYLDHAGDDLTMTYVNTWNLCAEACAYTNSCVAFSWMAPGPSSPCYMKSGVAPGTTNQGVWGARLIGTISSFTISGYSSTTSSTALLATYATSIGSNSSSSIVTSTIPALFTSAASSTGSALSSAAPGTSGSTSSLSNSFLLSTSTIQSLTSSAPSSLASSGSSSVASLASSTSVLSSSSSSWISTSTILPLVSSTSSSAITTTSMASVNSAAVSSSQSVYSSSSGTSYPLISSTLVSTTLSSSSSSEYLTASASSQSSSLSTSTFSTPPPSTALQSSISLLSSTSQQPASSSLQSTLSSTSSSTFTSSSSPISSQTGTSTNSQISSTTSSTLIASTSSSTTLSTSTIVSTTLSTSFIYTASTSLLPSATILSPWNYIGCANDTTSIRALSSASISSSTMNITTCQNYCQTANYQLAGLEYGSQCYCGSALAPGFALGQTGCTMACGGASSQICGGRSRLSVYNNTAYIQPSFVPSVGNFNLYGCYNDSVSSRTLSSYVITSTSMTVESCVSSCSSRGFSLAGVEYSGECYCGNTLAASSTEQTLASCGTMFCSGNQTEYCGGPSRLLVYQS